MNRFHLVAGSLLLTASLPLGAAELPKVTKVDLQPLAAQTQRVVEALDYLGAPLTDTEKATLKAAADEKDSACGIDSIQTLLDKHCVAGVTLQGAEGQQPQLETHAGLTKADLAEQGWRVFLVKVINPQGRKGVELRGMSANASPMYFGSTGKPDPQPRVSLEETKTRFLDLQMFNDQPLVRTLAGLELEYRIIQIYCREAGDRKAELGFGL